MFSYYGHKKIKNDTRSKEGFIVKDVINYVLEKHKEEKINN